MLLQPGTGRTTFMCVWWYTAPLWDAVHTTTSPSTSPTLTESPMSKLNVSGSRWWNCQMKPTSSSTMSDQYRSDVLYRTRFTITPLTGEWHGCSRSDRMSKPWCQYALLAPENDW